MKKTPLLDRLIGHCFGSTGIKDPAFWESVMQAYPSCIYTGQAYRAVLTEEPNLDTSRLYQPASWSISLNGLWNYVSEGKNYNLSDPGFHLVSADIVAISLSHIFALERSNGIDLPRMPIREDEVYSIELISLKSIEFTTFKNFPKF